MGLRLRNGLLQRLLPVGRAVESVLRDGETMPVDLGGSASTQAIGDAVVSALERA